MTKERGFEIAKGWEDKEIHLPKRQTKGAAGYDFEAAEDVVIPSLERALKTREAFITQKSEEAVALLDSCEDEKLVKEFNDFFELIEADELEVYEMISTSQQKRLLQLIAKLIDSSYEKRGVKHDFLGDLEKIEALAKPVLVKTGVKAFMMEDEKLDLYNRSSNAIKRGLMVSNGVGLIDSDYYENESNDGHIMFQFINFGNYDVTIKKGERIGQGVFTKFLKTDDDFADTKRIGGHGSTKN